MNTKTHQDWTRQGWLVCSFERIHTAMRRERTLILLIAMVGWTTCGAAYADSIIGSPDAGLQSWTVSFNQLNTNGAPYWDYPTQFDSSSIFPPGFPPFFTSPPGQFANVGFCLTGTLNCCDPSITPSCPQKLLQPGPPPGAIPFWGMPYDSVTDTGGAVDPKFFFKRDTPNELRATLELQTSNAVFDLFEFGWFETNEDGNFAGQRHPLFMGGEIGTSVTFTPTQFYGYYFVDKSENCLVFTLSGFTEMICTASGVGLHTLAAFATDTAVNALVSFEPLTSTFSTTSSTVGCPSGFVGKFEFQARLRNQSSSPALSNLLARVITLTEGNLLQNADGGPAGVGAGLSVPKIGNFFNGTLIAGAAVDVGFSICLKNTEPFSFSVDLLGIQPLSTFWIGGLNAAEECQGGDCNMTLVKVEPSP